VILRRLIIAQGSPLLLICDRVLGCARLFDRVRFLDAHWLLLTLPLFLLKNSGADPVYDIGVDMKGSFCIIKIWVVLHIFVINY